MAAGPMPLTHGRAARRLPDPSVPGLKPIFRTSAPQHAKKHRE